MCHDRESGHCKEHAKEGVAKAEPRKEVIDSKRQSEHDATRIDAQTVAECIFEKGSTTSDGEIRREPEENACDDICLKFE